MPPSQPVWPDLAEIPPLLQNFKTLGQYFEGLVSVGQNFEPTLANLLYYLANFHCFKWPNIKQLIKSSGHTASVADKMFRMDFLEIERHFMVALHANNNVNKDGKSTNERGGAVLQQFKDQKRIFLFCKTVLATRRRLCSDFYFFALTFDCRNIVFEFR